jgi:uncharacterized protein (DUF2249 family)
MTVARLLEQHPQLVDVLASYHSHFKLLRNGPLRRVMAPRVTLAQAARIAGVSVDDLLANLRTAVGETSPPAAFEELSAPPSPPAAGARPAAIRGVPESRQMHVDVRDDIRSGREPFAKVMAAVKRLGADELLVLRAPFEPVPLYDVLGKRGFAHWTEQLGHEDWAVWFYRDAEARAARRDAGVQAEASPASVLDVRGLEPPEPMVRVLEALERLQPGERLEVLHERRPMILYPQLDERGFTHETDEPQPGLVRIVIHRARATS